MVRKALLARTLVELTDTIVEDFDVVELLTLLTDRCVETLGISAAGLLLVAREGDLRVMASSSEALPLVDLFELQSSEGPCPDCCRTGKPVRCSNLDEAQGRWPRFTAIALKGGFRSVDALPMLLRGRVVGALNLLRTNIGEMDKADVQAAQALADVAAMAVLQHHAFLEAQAVTMQLNHALDSRVAIEQAKGILAELGSVNMEVAFARLRNHARNHNLRLADVARGVVDGTLTANGRLWPRLLAVPEPLPSQLEDATRSEGKNQEP